MAAEDAINNDTLNATSATNSTVGQMVQRLRALNQRQKIAAAVMLSLAIALIVGGWIWMRTPEYGVLFSNLDERDGGAIMSSLQQQNIPYQVQSNGTLLILKTKVHETRLKLAAEGLPSGGLVGFEVMENQRLGVSQFLEKVNYQRALEGELARTIQNIASVLNARVHLAIPKQTGFLRDEQHPSASVMVNLRPGSRLNKSQVAGIVHLVAASVPKMKNQRVNLVDQDGKLLTNNQDALEQAELDATQIEYVRIIENGYIERVNRILETIVGKNNYKAQVTADIDFNRVEETAETFSPNPPPQQAIRSQQTHEEQKVTDGPGGVPGALTNQPPVPATAPIVTPGGTGNPTQNQTPSIRNRSATLNYELDRKIQHVRQAVGQIKRLSVAVVVNYRTEKKRNGDKNMVAPSEEEIARITSLVREAMGFSESRGDSLSVTAAEFAPLPEQPEMPLWKDPEIIDIGKEVGKYVAFALIILLTYLLLIRPLVRIVTPPPPEEEDMEDSDETAERQFVGDSDNPDAIVELSGERPLSFEEKIASIRDIVHQDPKVVANLIKEWLEGKEIREE